MNRSYLAEPHLDLRARPGGTRHFKGGGGDQAYYENLNALYGEQAAMGRVLRGVAEDTVIPAYRGLVKSANEFDSIPNRELAATRAMRDMTVAGEAGLDSLAERLVSTGAPMDENMIRQMRAYKTAQAPATAQAGTQARNAREREGYARRQDAVSIGMGIPGQATAAFNSAGNTANAAGRMQLAQNQQESDNWANVVQGGVNAYQIWKAADGGYVSKKGIRRPNDGAPRFAAGGFMGGAGMAPPLPPMSRPASPQAGPIGTGIAGLSGYKMGEKLAPDIGKGIEWMGNQAASPEMAAFGQGMRGMPPEMAKQAASQQVNSALGADAAMEADAIAGATDLAGTSAADAAMAADAVAGATDLASAATAAETAALATTEVGAAGMAGAASGLGAAGAAIGTAMPWIGAAMLAGSALGLFKDGGEVQGYAAGGPTRGFDPDLNRRDYIAGAMGLPTGTDARSLLMGPGKPIIDTLRALFADGGRADATPGGEVDGPGGPEDDAIPAWLSDGEFVLNADAVRHFGLDRLNKMNQVGLDMRYGKGAGTGEKKGLKRGRA